jgi:aminoglycoside phosphotransferase (APT) family kinase protein
MDVESLQRFFDEELGASAAITVTPLVGGGSCEAFAIDRGTARWVLRRAPRHANVASAHDVLREYKILDAIKDEPVSYTQMTQPTIA